MGLEVFGYRKIQWDRLFLKKATPNEKKHFTATKVYYGY
jgi:hypothetical protein